MRYVHWARSRFGRLLTILLAVLVYFLLLVLDGQKSSSSSLFPTWTLFGFSAFVALLFLAIGALVWLYARSRGVAALLFCFSLTMMATFAVQTGASSGDPLLSSIGGTSSALTLSFFAILLLFLPRNYLALESRPGARLGGGPPRARRSYATLLLYAYLAVLALLTLIAVLRAAFYYVLPVQLASWLTTVNHIYFLVVFFGILITIFVSYRRSSSLRARQQLRLFLGGVILSFAPLLILTVLPLVLGRPQYIVNSQLSTLTFIALPLALSYSILRYQLLVFDRYIRQIVAWMAAVISLAVLGYLVVVIGEAWLPAGTTNIFVVAAMILLVPTVWWLAHMITDRLFFRETAHYGRLIDEPGLVAHEVLNLDEACALLSQAAVNVFGTEEVALFVLDEDTGHFRLAPPLKEHGSQDVGRRRPVRKLLQAVKSVSSEGAPVHVHASLLETGDFLDTHHPVFEYIASSRRPVLLSEAILPEAERSVGISRYLTSATSGGADLLLTAVRAQGKLIGVLVLGERGDHQPYSGPDFEVIELILDRYAALVETARLYELASRHVAILDALYSATAKLEGTFETVEDVAITYAQIAAQAIMAGAEIWLYESKEKILRQVVHTGSGPRIVAQEPLTPPQESDWSAWFYEGESSQAWKGSSSAVPAYLPQTPCYPFAWLPLVSSQLQLGLLVLTYSRPHHFSQEEKRVLSMFASQYASALENAQKTIALRAAYERQKELDHMKDQFITTASHELRTPLTAVQGYIELLIDHDPILTPELRREFVTKAQRSCDELTLMVNNIMESGRVNVEVESIKLSTVSLATSVQHIVEILEGITQSEERAIQVDIHPELHVIADDLRLRQVLLNLVGNGLKYSPQGSAITISAHVHADEVIVHVRDYGLGVPPEDQEYIFERFMRLERDINSPTRGAGLGLYISKRLIEAMDGRIWIESSGKEGEGSTFLFSLKYASEPMEQSLLQEVSRMS